LSAGSCFGFLSFAELGDRAADGAAAAAPSRQGDRSKAPDNTDDKSERAEAANTVAAEALRRKKSIAAS
jgi:hypothetical protein